MNAKRSSQAAMPGRRKARAELMLVLGLLGCSQPSAASHGSSGAQRFLAGPSPEVTGRDVRFLLEVPRSFLPARDRPNSEQPVETAAVSFAVHPADFSPAGDAPPGGPAVIFGRVGWAEAGYVRRSVDGSWDNHFSIYNRPAGERFGLEMRRWQDYQWQPAELYVSLTDERQLRIECDDVDSPSRPNSCEMSVQRAGEPFVTISFREDDLPRWREIEAGVHRLVRGWTLSREGAPQ